MTIEETVTVGKISKIYGNNGRLSLSLYDTFPQDFSTEEPLFVHIDGLAVPLFCDFFTRRGKSGATVEFADIDNEFRASELIGKELFMLGFESDPSEQLDNEDRLYLEDMVGWTVHIDNAVLGKRVDFIDGQNPLFAIDLSDGAEEPVLVPAVDEFMVDIDVDNQSLTISLPEGLLDLN